MKNVHRQGIWNYSLKKEAQYMKKSHDLCRNLSKNFTKSLCLYEKITFPLFKRIWDLYDADITKIFGPLPCVEIFNFFDEDMDGYLIEDELIMVFSILKAKLCHLDQELICEGLYKESTETQIQIKKISNLVFEFQNFLRKRLYAQQLSRLEDIKRKHTSLSRFWDFPYSEN